MLINIAAFLLSCGIAQALPYDNGTKPGSKGLEWKECTDALLELAQGTHEIECAVLNVPLDYTDSNSEDLPLALVRNKATKKPSKGTVLYNPGGPGVSGFTAVLLGGAALVEQLGGHFDVIGFDPRGAGSTIPFKCPSPDNSTTPSVFQRADITVNLPHKDLYETVLQNWDATTELVEACYKANEKTGRFLSTAFVARDMLEMVDALDEGGNIRYWGVSYGTTLGQTFAAMFPDRIERMLLDSVQLAPDYYQGYALASALDSNRALAHGFEQCIEAGKAKCPVAAFGDTAEDLMLAYANLLQSLLDSPSDQSDQVYMALKSDVFSALYSPSGLLQALKLIEYGFQDDFSGLLEYQATLPPSGARAGTSDDEDQMVDNAILGITCIDNPFRADSPEELYGITAAMTEIIPFPDLPLAPVTCAQWKFEAAERYDGGFRNITTSYPIMFANGPYDPITSLSNAYVASIPFKGSTVLRHNGFGHGVTSQPSNCTNAAIAAYFEDGTLPKNGDTCQPNENIVLYALDQAGQDSV